MLLHNLSQQTTSFIGRYKELSELNALLNNPDIRFVTVTIKQNLMRFAYFWKVHNEYGHGNLEPD